MVIKLQRVGGILPITREATTDVNWSEQETKDLLQLIRSDNKKNAKGRDMTSHYLEVDGEAFPVDLEKLPSEFKSTFEELKTNLKPVKS